MGPRRHHAMSVVSVQKWDFLFVNRPDSGYSRCVTVSGRVIGFPPRSWGLCRSVIYSPRLCFRQIWPRPGHLIISPIRMSLCGFELFWALENWQSHLLPAFSRRPRQSWHYLCNKRLSWSGRPWRLYTRVLLSSVCADALLPSWWTETPQCMLLDIYFYRSWNYLH